MPESALRVDELRKSYRETVALDGVSFDVGAGQMFGFVGPNGAGKTTLMRIVLGVLAADSGRMLWRGAPIDADARRRIGYMPEERGLYPKMRVRDQLVYMARLHGAGEAEAGTSADRWMERLGIEERAGDAVESLSLGNQQRVQLGVALVPEPDLLVLDEPFSGLDPDGVDALSGALVTEISERQVPVVFSSHQLELVAGIAVVSIVTSGGTGVHTRHLATAGPRAAAIAAKARTEAKGYGIKLEVEDATSAAVARERVKGENADAALGPRGITVGNEPDDALVALLQNAARTVSGEAKLRAAGLFAAAARAALEPPPLPTVEISTGEGAGGTGLAHIGALLLYVALISLATRSPPASSPRRARAWSR